MDANWVNPRFPNECFEGTRCDPHAVAHIRTRRFDPARPAARVDYGWSDRGAVKGKHANNALKGTLAAKPLAVRM
jgi:hypothetical protein